MNPYDTRYPEGLGLVRCLDKHVAALDASKVLVDPVLSLLVAYVLEDVAAVLAHPMKAPSMFYKSFILRTPVVR